MIVESCASSRAHAFFFIPIADGSIWCIHGKKMPAHGAGINPSIAQETCIQDWCAAFRPSHLTGVTNIGYVYGRLNSV